MRNNSLLTFAFFLLTLLALPLSTLRADVLFSRPPANVGPTILSAYYAPDGSPWDERIWDSFVLTTAGDITEIRWRGGYGGPLPGGNANVLDFEISIWASTPNNLYPDIGLNYGGQLEHLVLTDEGLLGNADETYVGTIGGVAMYDYHVALPQSFHAVGGTTYWIQIVAWQPGYPNWGLAQATGGNNSHLARVPGPVDNFRYINGAGDPAFSLIGTTPGCSTPTVTVHPVPFSGCWNGGRSITLTAAATGVGPLTYRWLLNGNVVYDGGNGGGTGGGATISGATTPTLNILDASYWHDVGTYTCQITNTCGSVTTDGALVEMPFSAPAITSSPASATLCSGGAISLIAGVSDSVPSTRTWSKDGIDLIDGTTPDGTVITGAATATLTLSNFQSADSGSYVCRVSNACGASETVPASVTAPAGCSLADVAVEGACPDGIVDGPDFINFINSFGVGDMATDPLADVNIDGTIDGSDFIDFINAFTVGC